MAQIGDLLFYLEDHAPDWDVALVAASKCLASDGSVRSLAVDDEFAMEVATGLVVHRFPDRLSEILRRDFDGVLTGRELDLVLAGARMVSVALFEWVQMDASRRE